MWPLFIIFLFAVGPLFSEDLRGQAWVWVASGVCWLALIGLAYGKWRDFQAREAIIQTERNTRR